MIEVETEFFRAEFAPEAGGNLCRLLHKPSGCEILRRPESLDALRAHPALYGLPVLFPPNRIDGGKFRFQGRAYALPLNEPERGTHLHGLALGKPWRVSSSGANFVKMEFEHIATQGFMHDFALRLNYSFQGASAVQELEVENKSALDMPFGAGFHSALVFPAGSVAKVSCGEGRWEILKPRMLPSGKLIPWEGGSPDFNSKRAVSFHFPTGDACLDGESFRGALLERSDALKVCYEVDSSYRHWHVWNDGGGKGFICIEPMTWMTNSPNSELPPSITGFRSLAPHSTWRALSKISVFSRRCP